MWCGPSCECGWGGTTLATAHNNRSQKFQMIVSECSDWDVEVAFYVRLNTSGTSMDFDLMLWQCDDASFSAGCYVRDVAADTGLVKKDGHCFFDTWGEDDTTFWIVEVKYDLADSSGASCNDWTLEVRGHDDDFARIGHSWCP
jgi:hypothetical protein